jgi:hypothetical protein
MGPVNAELGIDAPRELIFDFVSDLSNRPAFTDHFISDHRLFRVESRGVGAGARFRFVAPPQAIWMDSTISALERPHRISERGSGGRFNRVKSATEWELLADAGALTTVRVTYWTETSHPIDRLKEIFGGASIWYQRDWATALRRLRDLLEVERSDGRTAAAGGTYSTPVHQ